MTNIKSGKWIVEIKNEEDYELLNSILPIPNYGKGKPRHIRILNSNYAGWTDNLEYYAKNEPSFTLIQAKELIEESKPQYQPITPKVGDKFRVVKNVQTNMSNGDIPSGFITEVVKVSVNDARISCPNNRSGFWMNGGNGYGFKYFFTTEYLEPVESKETLTVDTVPEWKETMLTPYGCDVVGCGSEPMINPYITKPNLKTKMTNFIKKLTQSAEDKTLEKANFTNSCGELTSIGNDALISLIFADKKAELVKLAEQMIAESEE